MTFENGEENRNSPNRIKGQQARKDGMSACWRLFIVSLTFFFRFLFLGVNTMIHVCERWF